MNQLTFCFITVKIIINTVRQGSFPLNEHAQRCRPREETLFPRALTESVRPMVLLKANYAAELVPFSTLRTGRPCVREVNRKENGPRGTMRGKKQQAEQAVS